MHPEKIWFSDALSPSYLSEEMSEILKSEMELYAHSIVQNLSVSAQRWKQLQLETANVPSLQKLKDYTLRGWSSEINLFSFTLVSEMKYLTTMVFS